MLLCIFTFSECLLLSNNAEMLDECELHKVLDGAKLLDRCDYVKCDQLSAKNWAWIPFELLEQCPEIFEFETQLPNRIEWNRERKKEKRQWEKKYNRILFFWAESDPKKGRPTLISFISD